MEKRNRPKTDPWGTLVFRGWKRGRIRTSRPLRAATEEENQECPVQKPRAESDSAKTVWSVGPHH